MEQIRVSQQRYIYLMKSLVGQHQMVTTDESMSSLHFPRMSILLLERTRSIILYVSLRTRIQGPDQQQLSDRPVGVIKLHVVAEDIQQSV